MMITRAALCGAFIAISTAVGGAREVLPDNVIPAHYDVYIAPDLNTLTWRGEVGIAIDVKRATADIVLNSAGLAFDRVTLDGTRLGTARFDAKLGRATLHFASAVAPGRHALSIAYRGRIGHDTLGFFAMDYATSHGPRRTLATNFEPAYARQFLPCWDEPGRKATFTLTVDAPNNRIAVSNMPIVHIDLISPEVKRVHFMATPRMSTYLLFLAIGDFERIDRTVDGVDVGVLVNRGDTAKGVFALGEATRLLHYYDDYFGYHYPLPKLDLIAAPGTIEGGSMENWGAIFYSQDELLLDPGRSTEADRRDVFETIAHEMSHQWFGDLVTMAWWDNLWLNEGFARWMQTYAADALHPEWKTSLIAQSIFERGKRADAEPDTHPIVEPVDTAAQAYLAFNAITYNKGAAVITMLNTYVGADAFRDGVRRYMRSHAFGNTVDTDLWSIMQSVARKPILAIEHDFTRHAGVPLLRVTDARNGIHLAEDRFYADPSQHATPERWTMPLAIAAPGATVRTLVLKNTADLGVPPPALVNAGQIAYARVLYPQSDFENLLAETPQLSSVDRLGLMNDASALGLAAYAPLSNFFLVVARLQYGANPVVWSRVVELMTALDRYYPDGAARTIFRDFAGQVLGPVLAAIGNTARTGEDANTPTLRNTLVQALGRFADASVIARARHLVAQGGGTPEQQRTAIAIDAMQADGSEFDRLLTRARATKDPLDKERIYQSLSGVQDPALAKRMIAIVLGDEVPAGSNAELLIDIAEDHPDLAWREGVPHLAEPAAGIERQEQWQVAASVAGLSADPARIADAEAYEGRNVPADARRPFIGAVASIRRNQRIAAQVLPKLDRWITAELSK